MPQGNDCAQINQCLTDNMCQDQECAQQCLSQATPAGQNAFIALATCANNNCANETDPTAQQQCITTNCAAELEGCFGGATGPGGNSMGFCLEACNPTAPMCTTGDFCFDLGQGAGACAAGSADMPMLPPTATQADCNDPNACAADQVCVITQ